jgi:NAD(P)-dependent dehydrogenase (short-subunit alcohol dehydrogenase family)
VLILKQGQESFRALDFSIRSLIAFASRFSTSVALCASVPTRSARAIIRISLTEAGKIHVECRTHQLKLKGKIALVTGAARGIGRGIAEVFAEEGADVVVNDIVLGESAELVARGIRALGGRAMTAQADVSKRDEVEAMFEKVWSEFGPVDILVNNAGIETITPFLELTDEQWTRVTNVNLRGPWLCSQIFCRHALAGGRNGNIVHIGSIQAAKILPGRTHYAPAKLGIEALTRNMSAEMTPRGIRVNCVHPGFIATDMTAWIVKNPEILPQIVAQISVGRAGEPRDIGKVVAFLASEESSYVTGQSLHVDGGWILK